MIKSVTRIPFDANNEEHREIAIYFLKNSSWKDSCPFELVWPYQDIPTMIKDKLLQYYIK